MVDLSEHSAPITDKEYLEPPPVPVAPTFDVGDRVTVAFWRPFAMPGRPKNGDWTTVPGRVVSIRADGSRLCYESDSTPVADYDTPPGSRIRFTETRFVFVDAEAAQKALPNLLPPE